MPKEFPITPSQLERSFDPALNPPTTARQMQHVDPTWLEGRLRRGAGFVHTQVRGPNTAEHVLGSTIVSYINGAKAVMFTTQDITVDLLTGKLYIAIPAGDVGCARSIVLHADTDYFTGAPDENTNLSEDLDDLTDDSGGNY